MNVKRNVLYAAITALSVGCLLIMSGLFIKRAVATHTRDSILDNRVCVIIDAGHGGVDGGAVSCSGVYESQINLQIALRLRDLAHLLGMNTKMIRTEDISVYTSGDTIAAKKVSDLKERVRIVNETDNAILISLHQNYFHDSRYSGTQVFYPKQSSELATKLQNAFVSVLNPGSRRQAKKADGIYLLQNIKCEAALIECGFLSHPYEEKLLRSDDHQKKICVILASVLSCYIHSKSLA